MTVSDTKLGNQLLQLAQRGDPNAVSQIYKAFFPSIYKFVRLQVEDTHIAEDITSEVFYKLVDAIRQRHGPRNNLRAWLYEVARNEVYRHFGKKRQMPTVTLEDWLPAAADIDLEIQFMRTMEIERAQRAFRMLVPEQQEVLILRFVEMLSMQETADVMKKSASAIKSLQFRAVTTLRKLLEDVKGEAHV